MLCLQAPPPKGRKELIRDANIKKIRTDPFFLGNGDVTSIDAFSDYLAGVLGITLEELSASFTTEELKKVPVNA